MGQPAPLRTLQVLFVLGSLDYLRFFQPVLELLAERGHRVRLLLGRSGHGDAEQRWLDRMSERDGFVYEVADHFGDRWSRRAEALRKGLEHVRACDPAYTWQAGADKRRRRAPAPVRAATRLPLLRSARGLRALYRALSAIERALPASSSARGYVAGLHPDLVVLCDYGAPGSLHSTYVQAAKELGIPTAICVASWDNLSTRQRMRAVPDRLLVWNETQVREAVELHGMPSDLVVACGAPVFDKWFTWQPRPRAEFLATAGLDADRPVILWVGGALKRAARTEADYAVEWLAALRAADDPSLREAGVLLRPHPYRLDEWRGVAVDSFQNAAIWPRDPQMPVDEAGNADYFDSIFHSSAVIGLNTSAMIEASIVGRPVLTILEPDFHDSQLGTFHFSYLLESSGGVVGVARSIEESLEQLSTILAGSDGSEPSRARRFVADFVRPRGLERPASPIVVEALEDVAALAVRPERESLPLRAGRATIVALLAPTLLVPDAARARLQRATAGSRSPARSTRRAVRRGARTVLKRGRRLAVVHLRAAIRARTGR